MLRGNTCFKMNTLIGKAYDKSFIDGNSIPTISKNLIPWIKEQIREIEEEAIKAPKELKKLNKSLDELKEKLGESSDPISIKQIKGAIDTVNTFIDRNNGEYLQGRIYLLNKIIGKNNK